MCVEDDRDETFVEVLRCEAWRSKRGFVDPLGERFKQPKFQPVEGFFRFACCELDRLNANFNTRESVRGLLVKSHGKGLKKADASIGLRLAPLVCREDTPVEIVDVFLGWCSQDLNNILQGLAGEDSTNLLRGDPV